MSDVFQLCGFLWSFSLMLSTSIVVEHGLVWRPQLRDANDEMVLEAAVNGRDFELAPSRFDVEVLLPRDALARINR